MKLDQKSRGLTTSLIDEHGKTVAVVDSDRAAEIARAVNSHEAAQRLAEALEGYERMSEKFTAISNPSREVVEQLQAALKFIAPATRAALAEWEAVK